MRGFERSENCREHSLSIGKHIVVPEPQNTEALRLQKSIAPLVGVTFNMLRSVCLDDHSRGKAHEIDNVRLDPHLTAELPLAQPPRP